jgi:hypothetical protein
MPFNLLQDSYKKPATMEKRHWKSKMSRPKHKEKKAALPALTAALDGCTNPGYIAGATQPTG